MGFGLLETDVADEVGVRDFASCWYGCFRDEEECAGAFDAVCDGAFEAEAMFEESSPFVCEAERPYFCFWAAKEFFKGALSAGGWCWCSG